MRVLRYVLVSLVVLLGLGAALFATGSLGPLLIWLTKPSHGWEAARKAPPPDYSDMSNWAAHPGKDSKALMAPDGTKVATEDPGADVFFIHPTGYMHNGDWNSPMANGTRTEENTDWMLANQASVFSSCCAIYAPRYRQASIYRFLAAPPDIAGKAMDLAYSDVVRAFESFLIRRGAPERPFLIAAHSQGTMHGMRLLREHIDGKPIAAQMVAAYLIGGRSTNAEAAALRSVPVCDAPDQTGCFLHYAAFGPGAEPGTDLADLVCVNPLSWRRDGVQEPAGKHLGGVPASGRFQFAFFTDAATGVSFPPLGAPATRLTTARCERGLLILSDQTSGPFKRLILDGANYHGLDYPVFHMDLRANVAVRIAAFSR
jgi:hypothetical protein